MRLQVARVNLPKQSQSKRREPWHVVHVAHHRSAAQKAIEDYRMLGPAPDIRELAMAVTQYLTALLHNSRISSKQGIRRHVCKIQCMTQSIQQPNPDLPAIDKQARFCKLSNPGAGMSQPASQHAPNKGAGKSCQESSSYGKTDLVCGNDTVGQLCPVQVATYLPKLQRSSASRGPGRGCLPCLLGFLLTPGVQSDSGKAEGVNKRSRA